MEKQLRQKEEELRLLQHMKQVNMHFYNVKSIYFFIVCSKVQAIFWPQENIALVNFISNLVKYYFQLIYGC